jgi:peptidyl-prolyl cis-trans isomerase B (cyclophilin B)
MLPRRHFLTNAMGLILSGTVLQACADEKPGTTTGKTSCPSMKENFPMVKLHTNHGTITLELDQAKAPLTVANFLSYVDSGHYSNTIFHRVIDGFMVQGGGMEPGMKEKATQASIKNEANNGLKNDAYTVAMARTSEPHSASSQFFINIANNDFLNFSSESVRGWGYCVFGKVVEGKDVVDKIKGVATGNKGGHQDVPAEDVIIERAERC